MRNEFEIYPRFIVRTPMFSYKEIIKGISDRREFIKVVSNPMFKESILYASPLLYAELDKYLKGTLKNKDINRIEKTLIKYAIRMGFRSTPFGTFSLCGLGFFGDTTSFADTTKFKIERSFDFEFMHYMYSINFEKLCYKNNIRLIANQTIRKYSSAIKFLGKNNNGDFVYCSMEPSDVVKKILGLYIKEENFRNGFLRLTEEYDITMKEYYNLIKDLVECMLLIPEYVTDLEKYTKTVTDRMTTSHDNLHDIVRQNKIFTPKVCSILSSKEKLSEYEQMSLFNNLCSLTTKFKELNIKNILKVDTYIDGYSCINNKLKESVYECYKIFCGLMPTPKTKLRFFIDKFKERYEGQSIPLLEALDPDEGIGYGKDMPCGTHSLLHELKFINDTQRFTQTRTIILSPYEQLLQKKMQKYKHQFPYVIKLESTDLKHIKQNHHLSYPSVSCTFKYVGKYNGYDIISDIHFIGPSACKMISRFAKENESFYSMCHEICQHEQRRNADTILCEISHLPQNHVGNILSRPVWRKAVCHLVTYPDSNSLNSMDISLSDLYLKIENNKMIIWSKSLDKQIVPRITSAFNHYYHTSSIYQFLGDMQNGGINENISLTINNLLNFYSYLPRVQYKNIVLSKRTWLIKDIANFTNKWTDMVTHLKSMLVPRFFSYSEGDNQMVFDLDSELSIIAFLDVIKSKKEIMIEEYLSLDDEFDSPKKNIEVILPLLKIYE